MHNIQYTACHDAPITYIISYMSEVSGVSIKVASKCIHSYQGNNTKRPILQIRLIFNKKKQKYQYSDMKYSNSSTFPFFHSTEPTVYFFLFARKCMQQSDRKQGVRTFKNVPLKRQIGTKRHIVQQGETKRV